MATKPKMYRIEDDVEGWNGKKHIVVTAAITEDKINDEYYTDKLLTDEYDRQNPAQLRKNAEIIKQREQAVQPQGSAFGRFMGGLKDYTVGGITGAANVIGAIPGALVPDDWTQGTFAEGLGSSSREILKNIITNPELAQKARDAESPLAKVGYAAASGMPIVGPMMADFGESIGSGDIAGTAGKATGLGVLSLAPQSPKVKVMTRGAAHGIVESMQPTARWRGLSLPVPLASGVAGEILGSAAGGHGHLGAAIGAAYPMVRGAIKGAYEASQGVPWLPKNVAPEQPAWADWPEAKPSEPPPVYNAEWAPEWEMPGGRTPGTPVDVNVPQPPPNRMLPPLSAEPRMSRGGFAMGPGEAESPWPGGMRPEAMAPELPSGVGTRSGPAFPMPPAGEFDITGTLREMGQMPPALPPPGGLARTQGAIPMPPGKPIPAPPVIKPTSPASVPTVGAGQDIARAAIAKAKPVEPPIKVNKQATPTVAPPVPPVKSTQDIVSAALKKSQPEVIPEPVKEAPQLPQRPEPPMGPTTAPEKPPVKRDFEVKQPEKTVQADKQTQILDWAKKRQNFTANQIMTEFGLSGEAARWMLGELKKAGKITGDQGRYNVSLPDVPKPETPKLAEVSKPVDIAKAAIQKASEKPPAPSLRQKQIDEINKKISEADPQENPEYIKMLKGQLKAEEKNAQILKTKTGQKIVEELDNLNKQIDDLESKNPEAPELPGLYRELVELERRRDKEALPNIKRFGARVGTMRDLHAQRSAFGMSVNEVRQMAAEMFGLSGKEGESLSTLSAEQLGQLIEEMKTRKLEAESGQ